MSMPENNLDHASVTADEGEPPPTADGRYRMWMALTEPGQKELEEQRESWQHFPYLPVICVVLRISNETGEAMRAAIRAIACQTYGRWELFLAYHESRAGDLHDTLTEVISLDAELRTRFLDGTLRVTRSVNDAMHLTAAEFVVVLDHAGLLAPNALFEVARLLNETTAPDLVYFDDDELSANGMTRTNPFFKPDWSPDLLLSTNYLSPAVVRRALFKELDGFDARMGEADTWDFILRSVEMTDAVAHIPKVLFHHRTSPRSGASNLQLQCIGNHLRRQGVYLAEARVHCGHVRVIWPVDARSVSIIIPSRDRVDLLSTCLTSILDLTSYPEYEVLVVDNGSEQQATREYYASLSAEHRVRIVDYPGSFNYSTANNLGVRQSSSDLLLFLNNDTEILECDWLEEMARWAGRPRVGAVGAKLLYPGGTIQHAGVIVGTGLASSVFSGAREGEMGPFGSADWYRNYLAVAGACLMMRREVFTEIGGFDERYELAYGDVELCMRAVAHGYRNVYTPFARLRHHESASRGRETPMRDSLRAYELMHRYIEGTDPYFNPNLSVSDPIPQIGPRDENHLMTVRHHLGLQ